VSLAASVASVLSGVEARAENAWNGVYLGFLGGYSAIDQDRAIHQTAPPLEIGDAFDFDETLLGIVGGYNYQQGQMILGLEGAFLLVPQDRSLVSGEPGVVSGTYTDQNWQGEAVLRAGYDAGSFLPFIAGGLALASFDTELFIGAPPTEIGKSTETHWGFTAGAGVEMQTTESIRLKLEYRFSQFFDMDYSFAAPGVYDQTNGFNSHTVRASAIVNF
jgi:outer membrane immunogenic protein